MSGTKKPPTPSEAFKRADAGYELFGKTLYAFSAMRQGVAASMGMRFGLVDREDIFTITVEELKGKKKTRTELGFYNQLFSDVVKVLWLCSIADSKVLRAERRTDEAKIDAFKWADLNGIALTSGNYFVAAGVFFQIMQDIAVSEGQIVTKSEPDDGDEGNE